MMNAAALSRFARAQWKAFSLALNRRDLDTEFAAAEFIREFLRDALAYIHLRVVDGMEMMGRRYPISFLACNHVPVVIAPHTLGLDDPDPRFSIEGSGSRRKSAFQLAQEVIKCQSGMLVVFGRQWPKPAPVKKSRGAHPTGFSGV